jgi:hypothetical protein
MASSHNDFRSIDTIKPIRPPLPDGILTTLHWTGFGLTLTIAAIGLFIAVYLQATGNRDTATKTILIAAPAACLVSVFFGAFFGSPVPLTVGILIIAAVVAITTAAALLAAKLNPSRRY